MPEETGDSLVDTIMAQFQAEYEDARRFAEGYRSKMAEDPAAALAMLEVYIKESRSPGPNREHRTFVEAVAGGPNGDYVVPIMNVVGEVYPELEPEQREVAITVMLKHLDNLNFINAQNHLEQVDNPQLLADLTADRPLYWPGYRRYLDFLDTDPEWPEVQEYLESAPSRYLFCLAVLREGYERSEDLRERFYAEYPDLVETTLDGLVARIKARAGREEAEEPGSYDESVDRQIGNCDPRFRTDLIVRLA